MAKPRDTAKRTALGILISKEGPLSGLRQARPLLGLLLLLQWAHRPPLLLFPRNTATPYQLLHRGSLPTLPQQHCHTLPSSLQELLAYSCSSLGPVVPESPYHLACLDNGNMFVCQAPS